MRRPASKIRDDIARLQEDLKAAETREAQRIGRIALKAGLGEIDIDEAELLAAFEDVVGRFQGKADTGRNDRTVGQASSPQHTATEAIKTGAVADGDAEA